MSELKDLKVGDLLSYVSNDPLEGVCDWHYCKVLTIDQIKMFHDQIISTGRNWQRGIHPSLIPEGFAIVPIEPTDEMQNAARDWSVATLGHAVGGSGSRGCYQAMINAAPKPTDK